MRNLLPSHSPRSMSATASLVLSAVALAACSDTTTAPNPTAIAATPTSASLSIFDHPGANGPNAAGAVYTLTNAASGNGVIAFHRAVDGSLTPLGTYPTGGKGTGGTVDPLTSQYAVVLDDDHDALFAVNAGSNQITSFHVAGDGRLTRILNVPSGGKTPVSLAMHDHLLYVLNMGDNTVTGYLVIADALLFPIPHSTRSLASGADGAAAVRFTPDGRFLVVSERVSNRLETFSVNFDGTLDAPVVSPASGSASFGFDITSRDQLIVSETQGSLSSYGFSGRKGALAPITASISTGGAAPCWVTITDDGRFAYATNAGSNFVAGFGVDAGGHLTALNPTGHTGEIGAGASPIDLEHVGNRFLYTLDAARGAISQFVINGDGSLSARADTPAGQGSAGLQGLAAY